MSSPGWCSCARAEINGADAAAREGAARPAPPAHLCERPPPAAEGAATEARRHDRRRDTASRGPDPAPAARVGDRPHPPPRVAPATLHLQRPRDVPAASRAGRPRGAGDRPAAGGNHQGRPRLGGDRRHGRRAATGALGAPADGTVLMTSTNIYELLRRCTVEHDWTQPPEGIGELLRNTTASQVGQAAAEHGVTNLLYLSTRGGGDLDSELRSLRGTGDHLNLTHHMKVIGELAAMSTALDAAAIPFMVVKGPVLAEVVYPRNDLRAYGDLDLVIPRQCFGDAITTLLESGCDMVDRN